VLVRTQRGDSSGKFKRNPLTPWHYVLAPTPPRHQQNQ
jgi:hypothetical protein